MKNFKFLSFLLIAASSLIFMQCTSDYTAIPGQDGIDGIDGVDGVDGIDGVGVQECIDCHSSEYRNEIKEAYAISRHGSGSSWGRGTSASCAQCHNNEGYIDYLSELYYQLDLSGDPDTNPNYGKLPKDANGNPIYVQSANPYGYLTSNSINCTGCHTDHRSFDFETDGNDYALRNIDPVKLVIDPTVSIDLANATEPLGLSNACVTCHQPRPSYPVPSGIDNIIITSFRYGPHYGPQSTMFEGIMGANIAGSVSYPGIGANGDNGHRKGTSCVECHMGESTAYEIGGHTWKVAEKDVDDNVLGYVNTCLTCHTSGAPTEVTDFNTDLTTLKVLLQNKKLIGDDEYVLGDDGVTRASSSNPLTAAVKDAQAIWNYKTLVEDRSNGVHNPKYAKALLKNTIEYLQSN